MNTINNFKNLHNKSNPLVLFNTWDTESSHMLSKKGVNVQATGSFAIAHVLGMEDGENILFSKLIDIVSKMNSSMLLLDFESCYASTHNELISNVNLILKENIVGFNIEDKFPNCNNLMSIEEFTSRISTIKATDIQNKLFINARTDIFFYDDINKKNQDPEVLKQCISRVKEYEKAGVDSIFIPGLKNKSFIEKISKEINIPINIMLDIKTDILEDYLDIGVSSICYGPSIYFDWLDKDIPLDLYFTELLANINELVTNNRITITL